LAVNAADGSVLVHGTCVAISDRGVLLRGAPGSGKSDLALRFISLFGDGKKPSGRARLVSDDQVLLSRDSRGLVARAPDAIAGKLEVRGVGIVEVDYCAHIPLAMIADLASAEEIPRLPPEPQPCEDILGIAVPVLKLNPFELSSPVKLKLALMGRP
jgi:serine kinase of HPr protein (carbohydrate metabolism regulator)